MTLYRQLTLSIIILFSVGFIGTTVTSTSNLRSFLETQLETHAQDTATSLGLSLSPHMRQQDLPVMNLMIDAIFDRGYFKSIRLVDIEGNTLSERTRDMQAEPVPDWFIRLVSFNTPRMEAIVMSGWRQAGIVSVTSHPGSAYRELWSNTRDTFLLFLAVAVIILLVALLTLKHLLRPLREVEKQAEAICGKSWVLQTKLPNSRELRSVVLAMNNLTSRVRDIFSEQTKVTEELRRQLYIDTLTGLPNRKSFNRECNLLIESGEYATSGALVLVKLNALTIINDSNGYADGDKVLKQMSQIIKNRQTANNPGFIARLSGSEFAIILHGVDSQEAEVLADCLCQDFKVLQHELAHGPGEFVHIGLTMWETGCKLTDLLAESDCALRIACSGTAVGWHRYEAIPDRESSALGKENLRSLIQDAVAKKDIRLCSQAVYSDADNELPVHREILVRLPDGKGGYSTAGIYQPVIDSMGIAISMDRLIIEKLLVHIEQDNSPVSYAINLSTASVTDSDFRDWLIRTLGTRPQAAVRIQLEMMENTVANHLDQARDLIDRLVSIGARAGIDHFGKNINTFGYLGTLKVSYIKVDGYYTRDIGKIRDNQFFIKALRDALQILEIDVIAQSVETRVEYETLRAMRLGGYQGYLFGKPEPLLS